MNVVCDEFTIINTQGIRFAEKVDVSYSSAMGKQYELRVTYKGDKMSFRYPSAEARDAQFAALSEALKRPRSDGPIKVLKS